MPMMRRTLAGVLAACVVSATVPARAEPRERLNGFALAGGIETSD